MRTLLILISCFLIPCITTAKDILIHPDASIIKENLYYFRDADGELTRESIEPGDRLVLLGREDNSRNHLQLEKVFGTAEKPITIANTPGTIVNINSDNTYGIFLNHCQHIRIDGGANNVSTSNPFHYGIQIRIGKGGQSIKADNGSNFISIKRVWIDVPLEVQNSSNSPAILVKSNVQCFQGIERYSANTFIMQQVHISNNRISNAGSEAIYIGETGNGKNTNCTLKSILTPIFNESGKLIRIDSTATLQSVDKILPHYLDDVVVSNNHIENSGWDGIQLSWCHNFEVKNNRIEQYGVKEENSHNYGIIIGDGCSGNVQGNFIGKGSGNGINAKPSGNTYIFNNVIAQSGFLGAASPVYHAGINTYAENLSSSYTWGKNTEGEKVINLSHNLIYRPYGLGIRMNGKGPNNTTREENPHYRAVCIANVLVESQNIGYDNPSSHNLQMAQVDEDTNVDYPAHADTKSANHISSSLDDVKLKNTSSSNIFEWDFRPIADSPLLDRAPSMVTNLEYRDYYDQLRQLNPGGSQSTGFQPDFGPAERVFTP